MARPPISPASTPSSLRRWSSQRFCGAPAGCPDWTSPVPLYFQLAQHFEAAIRSGALKVGSRLDNEVQLAERLGLYPPTVRAAFQYLPSKGLVVRKRGAGTLAANERIDRDVELTSLYDDLAAAGRAPGTIVIRKQVTHATRPSATGPASRPPPSSRPPGEPPGPAWTPAPAWCCAVGRTCARPDRLR